MIERLARLKSVSDLGSSLVSQLLGVRLIPHLDEVQQLRRDELGARRDLLMDVLRQKAPGWRWQVPPGGLFIWAQLPAGDARDLAQEALHSGVKVTPGTSLSVDGTHNDWLRLPFLLTPDPTANWSRASAGRLGTLRAPAGGGGGPGAGRPLSPSLSCRGAVMPRQRGIFRPVGRTDGPEDFSLRSK